jgi:hypothetical protein
MFIATSSEPTVAPNSSNASPSVTGVAAMASVGSTKANPIPLTTMTGRVPNRELSMPVNSIATSEPTPRHRRSTPSTRSSTARRSFA